MTPGETISEALQKLGWSETQLAREAGIDRAAIHKIIDGKLGLGKIRAERIISALGRFGVKVSLEELLQPPPEEIDRLVQQAEATIQRLEEARRLLQQAAGQSEHRGRDQSSPR